MPGQIAELLGVLGEVTEEEILAVVFIVNNFELHFPSGTSINDYSTGRGGVTIGEACEVISHVRGISADKLRGDFFTRNTRFVGDGFKDLVEGVIERLRQGGFRVD